MDKNELSPGAALIHRARTLLIGATVLWGLSFPLLRGLELAQKARVPGIADSTLAFADSSMRFGLAVLFLLPVYGRQLGGITFREWSQATGLAFFCGIGLYLQTLGLAWTDASVAAFLTQLYTLIVPLIVAVRDRRFPSLRVLVACALVLIGAAMLSPGLLTHLTLGPGSLVIIISTGFLASQIVWVERPVYAENRPGLVTLLMFLLLTLANSLGYADTGGTATLALQLFVTPALIGLTLTLVLFCTVMNFFVMNAWQRCVSATEAGLIYCIEPVIATILSSFLPGCISYLAGITYLNEMLTWSLAAGGTLIVGATVLVATKKRTA